MTVEDTSLQFAQPIWILVGVLVCAFVVGMFLTPPDVFSQTLLAVPMYLLYEAGIVLSKWLVPGWREVEAQRRGEIPGD